MKVYLAGSMSSRYHDRNAAAFARWSAALAALGHVVSDPTKIAGAAGSDWHAAMRLDVAALASCEAVAVVPGVAETDRGVLVEIGLALTLGLPVAAADSPWFAEASAEEPAA